MEIKLNVNPDTDAGGHYYYIDKQRYPSVTTIISAVENYENGGVEPTYLNRWRSGLRKNGINPEKHLRDLQIYGTMGHYRILNELSTTSLKIPEDVNTSEFPDDILEIVDRIHDMFDILKIKNKSGKSVLFKDYLDPFPRWVEKTMVSKKHKFAGQADLICSMEGNIALVDIKTSSGLRDHHILQLGAYTIMMEETQKIGAPDRWFILRLHPFLDRNPTLEPELHEIQDYEIESAREEFLDMVDTYYSGVI